MTILSEIVEELNNLFTDNPSLVANLPIDSVDTSTTDAYGYEQDTYTSSTIEAIPLGDDTKLLIANFGDNYESDFLFFVKTNILKGDIITWDSSKYIVTELNKIPIGTTIVGTFVGVIKQIKIA